MILSKASIYSIIPGIVGVFCIGFQSNATVIGNRSHVQQTTDSADIIINKYIETLGGLEKLKSIHTVYMEGSILSRGQKTNIKSWTVNNKATRFESTVNGFTSWSINRMDSGWSYIPSRGQKSPEPWPFERLQTAQPALDIEGSLVEYKSKGYKVEYKGIDQIEGSDVYKIEETLSAIATRTFYIDLDSYLIIRLRSKFITKNRIIYTNTDYSNYQKNADGYTFPMQVNNMKYSLVKVNTDISDYTFIPKK